LTAAGAGLFSRRQTLGAGLAVAGAALAPRGAAAAETPSPSLNAVAQTRGMRFGSAIAAAGPGGSTENPAYAGVVAGDCGLIVPENEMKMQAVRPGPRDFDFRRADLIMAFAAARGLAVRGHNLIWHNTKWLPGWLNQYDFGSRPATAAEELIVAHVTTVCRHFGDRIKSWDVINETIDPATGKMRETVLTRHLGDKVIDIAFHAARQALPDCQLVYNDYMEWEQGNETHRAGVLRLLERLRHDGVPVDALGLQSHIGGDSDLVGPAGAPQPKAWRDFLHHATGMGLDLLVTEMDMNDRGLPGDPTIRDAQTAAYAKDYLDVTLSFPQVQDVLAWGVVDRFSWLNSRTPRPDGLPRRPCPYDADFRPKPFRGAIAAALAAAPPRTPRHRPFA
jgi:endo-1,4-beta-xylanase